VTVVDATNKSFITNIPIRTPNLAPNGSVAPEADMSFHTVAADSVTGYVYVPAATGVRVFAATTGATVPTAHTGEPWSGWLYWCSRQPLQLSATACSRPGVTVTGRTALPDRSIGHLHRPGDKGSEVVPHAGGKVDSDTAE